ncbi:hypothetical protein ACOCJ5_06630 [Knoellia sp. CPCC 206450]|uniref:hypothetical protein n=1 Tax=Knoellia tibetensis TaxID=3404798 RepID=UPI003B429BA9
MNRPTHPARRAVLGAVAVSLAALAAPTLPTAQAAVAAGPQFTAATLNLGDATDADLASNITALSRDRGVSILGLQEAGDRADLLARVRDRAGMASWRWCRPDDPGAPSVPIMYDSDIWSLETACGGFLAVESRYLGPDGAGPDESKPKFVTAFVLHHRASGRNVRVLNTHFIPSARRNDLSDAEKQRRVDHVKDHVAALVDRIGRPATHPMPVVLMGDLNGPGSWPLLQPLKDIDLVGWSTEPTHDNGESLDHVVRRNLGQVSRAYVGTASDHKAVVNRLEF